MKRLKLFAGLLLAALILTVLLFRMFGQVETSKQTYKIASLKKGMILAVVTSTGTVNPLNTVIVGSQVSGQIQEIHVDFNSRVRKGQVITRIDPAVYAAQVELARAQLVKAQAQLLEKRKDIEAGRAEIKSAMAGIDSAKATLKLAELQYRRMASLADNKTVAPSELDDASARRDNAQGAMEVAQARLETARAHLKRVVAQERGVMALIDEKQAALDLAEVKLDYCTIRSPIDGEIILRAVDVGQTVAATLQSPVLFTIAEDLARMQVEVDVSEADVGRIRAGQKVEFTVDAYPERKFKAEVHQIRNNPTDIQNVVTYKVVADVDNASLMLRPGMTANVTIVVAEEEDVLKIPNAALRFRPLGEVKKAGPEKRPPVRERPRFKRAVSRLGMDPEQANQFEEIIKAAEVKLKASLQESADEGDRRQAWQTFLSQINTRLEGILRDDQARKLRAYLAYIAKKRKGDQPQGREAQVYVLDEDGLPKEVRIRVGISNETETKLVSGDLEEGDGVIVGMAGFSSRSRTKTSPIDALLRMFGRR